VLGNGLVRWVDLSFRGVLPPVCDLGTSTMRLLRSEFGCCVEEKEEGFGIIV
jgi:hypothetical protein